MNTSRLQSKLRIIALIEKNSEVAELRQALPYLVAYVFVWSCFYLYNYWLNFNIDPIPYISFNEIITNSSSLIIQCFAFALLILVCEALSPTSFRDPELSHEPLRQTLIFCLIVGCLSIGAFYIWGDQYHYLRYLPISTLIVAVRPLSASSFYTKSFSNYSIRIAVAALSIYLPVNSVVMSKANAYDILNRKGDLETINRPSGLCKSGCILAGKLGDYFLLVDVSNRSHMIKSSEMNIFTISKQHFENQQ